MSKMPVKKKSCFQITSVTQAQVAASSITDDTESLDDPDESRTEDVSSEIFDVSRADFEPEVCDRSSSEETLNNVTEAEAPGTTTVHIPQDGHLQTVSGPLNGGFGFRSTAMSGVAHAGGPPSQPPSAPVGVMQQPASLAGAAHMTAPVSQPAAVTPAASSVANASSCSSRFRVIKLDHGSGEPFRRGRWTCTEFYERDSEVITRTVDSIRHGNALDHGAERDSGLGATGGSVAALAAHSTQGPDSATDSSFAAHLPPAELGVGHQPASGVVGHGYGIVPGGKPIAVSTPQQTQVSVTPVAPPTHLLPAPNGMHANVQQVQQKSPSMPPVTQAQPFAYPTQPQAGHHLPSLIPAGQADYRQQHLSTVQPPSAAAPVSSLPIGPSVNQGPSPVMTPASGGVLGLIGPAGDSSVGSTGVALPGGQSAPAQGHLPQQGILGSGVAQQQQPAAAPRQSMGVAGNQSISINSHAVASSLQNVPAAVPGAPSTTLTMANQTAPTPGPSLQSQPQVVPSGSLSGAAVQNIPATFSQAPGNQVEENRRKSDALPQPSVISGKDVMKPLIPESLQLTTPSVNSLFGMSITIDGDDDSASGASIVAIDNKIEQAMDLVKSHLMYAVREEVEVLKEQIKELYERNSVLERENAVLKSLANNDQLSQLSVQPNNPCNSIPPQQLPASVAPQEGVQPVTLPQQPNVSSA
ncbi:TSC22 domain family protein 2-like isoform X2 [Brienomyrus brachyistius]|uniref:TSC22 domain family protein 2-like isoform X2 n=1 Tax=Brienomyrus brachyistius TaxID=42636 RepID=UPI0020B2A93D|nr:TSC22 domain family protein 2-like isoform X2 [Brienomyrus brachyistius]XP_048860377.1 TSC22 domain family protein 2-like isoform X2 [Brienomyrus brachyistius]